MTGPAAETAAQRFGEGAGAYDSRIRTLVPGYDTLHALTAALVDAQLPQQARVLCVGAGTGEELVRLAASRPDWQFTATDPAPAMLELARARADRAGLTRRTTFHAGAVETLPAGAPYNAATLILVLHFLTDPAARAALLKAIAARLQAGAPLLLALIHAGPGAHHNALLAGWKQWQIGNGADPTRAGAAMDARLAETALLSETEIAAELQAAGFAAPTRYFGAFLVGAWMALRR